MAKRHGRENFMIAGEGVLTLNEEGQPSTKKPTAIEEVRKFRFSRLGPIGHRLNKVLLEKLAIAMVAGPAADSTIPAGFTYLGQFVDHDLTADATQVHFGDQITVEQLIQARSPALDLDCLYGLGPKDPNDQGFYQADLQRLRVGRAAAAPGFQGAAARENDGFDLPRVGLGSTKRDRRQALIPDHRNDENLAVAQIHLALIRFHNAVIDRLEKAGVTGDLFERAREDVVKHYQWMVVHEFLPHIVDEAVLKDVFTNGRKFFEADAAAIADPHGTMPIEFSVGAYRLGHSMIRRSYEWNSIFQTGGTAPGTLEFLFRFSGTSGNMSPNAPLLDPNAGEERLPSNWIPDWRRLFDFTPHARPELAVPPNRFNRTMRIDTSLVDPLAELPPGSFGATAPPANAAESNLAFRNLIRGWMVGLASGQQMAAQFGVTPLTEAQIVTGSGGATLTLSDDEKRELLEHTPLWFYVLREAEANGGKLGAVGGRIVAETFHRALETSFYSILRDPTWKPTLGRDSKTFEMTDLLLVAFDGRADLLNLLG